MKTILYFRNQNDFRVLDANRDFEAGPFASLAEAIEASGAKTPDEVNIEISPDFWD